MCQFIFVQFKTPSAQVIPTLRRANPPKLRGSRSIIQSIFTTCTTSEWHPKQTNIHTLRSWDVYRETSGQKKNKEEEEKEGAVICTRYCWNLLALFWSHLTCEGWGQTFLRFFLNGRHCTAHIAHSVTKCGDQKCIEEQSSSISSNAQCQSWRLESSNLKGEISFHGRVIVTAHNSSLFCGVVWGQILRHRTGLDQDRQWQQFLNFCMEMYIKNKASQVNTSIHLKKSSYQSWIINTLIFLLQDHQSLF